MSDTTDKLPAPKPGALRVIEITEAVVVDVLAAFGIPGGAVIAAAVKALAESRLEKGTEVLIEELKNANICILNDEQAQVFIPNAYRFYEAVKQGEYKHNLRILARIMAGNAKEGTGSTADVLRFARTIEGLSEDELALLWNCHRLARDIWDRRHESDKIRFICAAELILFVEAYNTYTPYDRFALRGRLAALASRGLLIPDGTTRLSKGEEYYYEAPALSELVKLAKLEYPFPRETPSK